MTIETGVIKLDKFTSVKHDKKQYLYISFIMFFSLILIAIASFLTLNETYGVIFSLFLLILLSVFLKWNIDSRSLLLGLFVFLFFKIYGLYFIDPITGPDSVRYFGLVERFSDLTSFYNFAFYEIRTLGLFNISSITFYGLFYMPYYKLFSLTNPTSIAIFNSIMVVFIVFLWNKIFISFENDQLSSKIKPVFLNIMTALILLSPSMGYWSSVFLKDIFSLFLGVLSFYLFTKKRYILFIISLIFAIAIRPYAAGFIFMFWAFYKLKNKWAFIALIFAFVYVIYKSGLTGLFNTIPMAARILFVPNPLSLYNWDNFFLQTLEAFVILIGLIIVIISFFRNKNTRKVYLSFFLTLLIYACILTLVGQAAILHRDLDYGLFSAGDDMFRKKLPFVMIIYTTIAYALSTIKVRPSK